MTKPDDIPQDVWDYAKAVEKASRGLPTAEKVEHHARAIMAEREACAALADRWGSGRIERHRETGMSAKLVEGTISNLAGAIRNRGANNS